MCQSVHMVYTSTSHTRTYEHESTHTFVPTSCERQQSAVVVAAATAAAVDVCFG